MINYYMKFFSNRVIYSIFQNESNDTVKHRIEPTVMTIRIDAGNQNTWIFIHPFFLCWFLWLDKEIHKFSAVPVLPNDAWANNQFLHRQSIGCDVQQRRQNNQVFFAHGGLLLRHRQRCHLRKKNQPKIERKPSKKKHEGQKKKLIK